MRGLSLVDTPFVSNGSGVVPLLYGTVPNDTLEGYGNGALLAGLNGGNSGSHTYTINWVSPYASRVKSLGILATDSLETYSNGATLDTLNLGSGWTSAFVSR